MKRTIYSKNLVFSLIFGVFGLFFAHAQQDFITVFEQSDGQKTATYEEVMQFYSALDSAYTSIKTYKIGTTDAGEPLTLVTYNTQRSGNKLEDEFNYKPYKLLINNGIHPGEPDGIDATMLMMRDLAQGSYKIPQKVWIGAIAVYNIGGALNRNSYSRTNQNGPESYGFRGNARNYDLNRDFIKADTQNARAFAKIYHQINPDLFIDNHVSNGADYQYTLTHLFTQHDKMGGELSAYIHDELQPQLENDLVQKNWDITPYVNVFNDVPETGFSQFMDYPRYSSGYTTLWNTVGMMVETHMLKPYKPRVKGTYALIKSMIEILNKDGEKIQRMRAKALQDYTTGKKTGSSYPIAFEVDSSNVSHYNFKGYEGKRILSEVTGQKRLKYNRNQPFTKEVSYYDNFKITQEISVPKAYIIPQGWHEVLERLRENKIELKPIKNDTTIKVEVYRIADYDTRTEAYEGHYMHSKTQLKKHTEAIDFSKGDVIVYTAQAGLRYLIETLEPMAVDSFFNWNYFDTVLQQKEHFSPYVWEDKALELLEKNPELKTAFENKKAEDSDFNKNWYAQLDWLHKQSPNYEEAHLRYPIFRIRD